MAHSCKRRFEGDNYPYTPGGAVTGGDVVVLGTQLIGIAPRDIAASVLGSVDVTGIFEVPKDNSNVTAGMPLYWDSDGDPYGGTAGTGAFTSNSALGPFAGFALEAAGTTTGVVDLWLSSKDTTVGSLAPIPTATVAVGGTAIGNANAIDVGFTLVTGANNSAAIKLPEAAAGRVCIVKSATSGSTLQVFPAVNDTINLAAANAVYNMANLSMRTFVAYNAVGWYTDSETPT